jgi:curli production assembly/transport component CsgG
MENYIVGLILACILGGCSTTAQQNLDIQPPTKFVSGVQERLEDLPLLDAPPMTIAVYSFQDKTGQRKPNDRFSNLSSAVTQGADSWVIDALQNAAKGDWFIVIERGGLDNLVKERQLAKSTYEQYEKGEKKPELKPLKLAGLILEGGIVGYDANTVSGGTGLRYFGVGGDTSYRTDQVTVSMRLVSVNSGKVILTVNVTKTIASVKDDFNVFRFFEMGTRAFEMESGAAANEPTSIAVKAAIDQAIINMIRKGESKGLWNYEETDLYIKEKK